MAGAFDPAAALEALDRALGVADSRIDPMTDTWPVAQSLSALRDAARAERNLLVGILDAIKGPTWQRGAGMESHGGRENAASAPRSSGTGGAARPGVDRHGFCNACGWDARRPPEECSTPEVHLASATQAARAAWLREGIEIEVLAWDDARRQGLGLDALRPWAIVARLIFQEAQAQRTDPVAREVAGLANEMARAIEENGPNLRRERVKLWLDAAVRLERVTADAEAATGAVVEPPASAVASAPGASRETVAGEAAGDPPSPAVSPAPVERAVEALKKLVYAPDVTLDDTAEGISRTLAEIGVVLADRERLLTRIEGLRLNADLANTGLARALEALGVESVQGIRLLVPEYKPPPPLCPTCRAEMRLDSAGPRSVYTCSGPLGLNGEEGHELVSIPVGEGAVSPAYVDRLVGQEQEIARAARAARDDPSPRIIGPASDRPRMKGPKCPDCGEEMLAGALRGEPVWACVGAADHDHKPVISDRVPPAVEVVSTQHVMVEDPPIEGADEAREELAEALRERHGEPTTSPWLRDEGDRLLVDRELLDNAPIAFERESGVGAKHYYLTAPVGRETLSAAWRVWRAEIEEGAQRLATGLQEFLDGMDSPQEAEAKVDALTPVAHSLTALAHLEHGHNEPIEGAYVERAIVVLKGSLS